jgi:hypothetical protein
MSLRRFPVAGIALDFEHLAKSGRLPDGSQPRVSTFFLREFEALTKHFSRSGDSTLPGRGYTAVVLSPIGNEHEAKNVESPDRDEVPAPSHRGWPSLAKLRRLMELISGSPAPWEIHFSSHISSPIRLSRMSTLWKFACENNC